MNWCLTPSEWAKEQIGSLSVHVPVFWVEEPYDLLEKGDLTALAAKAEKRGRVLITSNNAFRPREQLLPCSPSSGGHHWRGSVLHPARVRLAGAKLQIQEWSSKHICNNRVTTTVNPLQEHLGNQMTT